MSGEESKRVCVEEELKYCLTRYEGKMLRVAMVYLQNISEAQIAVQKVFFELSSHATGNSIAVISQNEIMKLLIHSCRKLHYMHKHERAMYICEIEDSDKALLIAIMNLNFRYREIILLHYYLDFQLNEIARIQHVPSFIVELRLRKAMDRIDRYITETKCTVKEIERCP